MKKKREKSYLFLSILIFAVIAFVTLSIGFSKKEEGNLYYVGKVNCSDQGHGRKDKPFCSLRTATEKLRAGDTLVLLPGRYREPLLLRDKIGKEGAPIQIRGTDPKKVILEGGCSQFPCSQKEVEGKRLPGFVQIVSSHQILLERLTVQRVPTVGVFGKDSERITLRGLLIQQTGLSGIKFEQSREVKILHNRLRNINLGWIGRGGEYSQAEESVSIKKCEQVEVAFNHLSNSFQEGIDFKEGTKGGSIHHNIVERVNRVGIYINEADHLSIFKNIIRKIGFFLPSTPLDKKAIDRLNSFFRAEERRTFDVRHFFLQDGSIPTDWYLRFIRRQKVKEIARKLQIKPLLKEIEREENPHLLMMGVGIVLANGDLGDFEHPHRPPVETGRVTYIQVYQNLIHHTLRGGISIHNEWRKRGLSGYKLDHLQIFNNTLYKVNLRPDHNGSGIIFDFKITHSLIQNNIIAFAQGALVIDKMGFTERGRTVNAYKGKIPRTLDEIDVTANHNLFYRTLAPHEWYVVTGESFLEEDPFFLSPEQENFQLQKESPAIDHGVKMGLPFTGKAPDLGAYEYGKEGWRAGVL